MKPPMPYYGGKQRIAEQIVSHFPSHSHYVEPFAGGLSVFLAKEPAQVETLNDLDGELVTFWRVLRDRPDDLMRVCTLTPHARAEIAVAREPMDDLDELEVARRVWAQLTQARAGRRTRTGWRFYVNGDTDAGMATYLKGYVDRMPAVSARLLRAQLECMPALDMIGLYGRSKSTLLYVDPPYLATTRRSLQYKHELHTVEEHTELAEALHACAAAVVLSGYHSPVYDDLYQDWSRVEIAASTQQSGEHAARTEVLWINRPLPETLPLGFGVAG